MRGRGCGRLGVEIALWMRQREGVVWGGENVAELFGISVSILVLRMSKSLGLGSRAMRL